MSGYKSITRGWPDGYEGRFFLNDKKPKPNSPARGRWRIKHLINAGRWSELERRFNFQIVLMETEGGRKCLDWRCIPKEMYEQMQREKGGVPATIIIREKDQRLFPAVGSPKRRSTFKKQRGRCYYCVQQTPFNKWTLDHLLPQALGGTNAADNIRGCCDRCNNAKGCMTEDEFWKSEYLSQLRQNQKPHPERMKGEG